jgi:hydrogenase maturation protein HypF
VQGVGFRPFIYKLANSYSLKGEVDNRTNGVLITVEGDENKIQKFREDILKFSPPAARIKSVEIIEIKVDGYRSFNITTSKNEDDQVTEISPDIAVCGDCLEETETGGERKDYPFVNCTCCGPRFSIIEGLPYDRHKTAMKAFKMCDKCASEFSSVYDRRFHAQPIACKDCGPVYTYYDKEIVTSDIEEVLTHISTRIKKGKAVAIKGTGGYHLLCNALNNNAVADLRINKHRDSKPFAVMFSDIDILKQYCFIDPDEESLITSWRRPVLILKQKKKLTESVNSGLNTIGAILPYMPIHYMIFRKVETRAMVFTSGNISDEPVIADDDIAMNSLFPVTGCVVSYNRKIFNKTDDSVARIINGKPCLIRRSRGYVPSPVDLNCNVDGVIALGAEQKSSFCIGRDNQAIMSQYIGDLKNLAVYEFFKKSLAGFMDIFRFKPRLIACDLHPDYLSTRHAGQLEDEFQIPVIRVQHHHAHIASCMAENGLDEKVIGICLDGTGYGTDANTWGGEILIADLKEFSRFAHFDYVPMPGGDKAVDEPWRMAFSYLYKYYGNSIDYTSIPAFQSLNERKITFIKEMIDKKINSPLTSGAGRLFDAVSSLLGLCTMSDFDSEAPMRLESVISGPTDGHYPYEAGPTIVFAETLKAIMLDMGKQDLSTISARFHNTVAMAIAETASIISNETSVKKVVLSGGVFQNKYLTEKLKSLLAGNRFEIFTNNLVPSNDGGISLGQLVIASKAKRICA